MFLAQRNNGGGRGALMGLLWKPRISPSPIFDMTIFGYKTRYIQIKYFNKSQRNIHHYTHNVTSIKNVHECHT